MHMNILPVLGLLVIIPAIATNYLAGPGLEPINIVMPARYININLTYLEGLSLREGYQPEIKNNLEVKITASSKHSSHCRIWTNILDRKDGTFLVRYKLYEVCYDMVMNIKFKDQHLKGSPIYIKGPVLSDDCNCPQEMYKWMKDYGCPKEYTQIENDLKQFRKYNMSNYLPNIIKKYHRPESASFCHYVVKSNEVYRKCYGQHVGFNMFADNILLFLLRKVKMPDLEFIMNLGDWPLVKKSDELAPMFSWCGSDDTIDIVLPTYDITESTLENMGRVTLDILSVQGSTEFPWEKRQPRAFWRGRDSRPERLRLIEIAREYPDLINASLTNFFFYRDKEAQYGPKQPPISFFNFFDYKYQLNIDGTVAAYRFPYLLAGGSLVLKQSSPYYEHFYKNLEPWVHYVPIKRDLSDVIEQINWARKHDKEARQIAANARKFVEDNLMPQNIICYHAVLFKEWSTRLENVIEVYADMTHVPQTGQPCDCDINSSMSKEEL